MAQDIYPFSHIETPDEVYGMFADDVIAEDEYFSSVSEYLDYELEQMAYYQYL